MVPHEGIMRFGSGLRRPVTRGSVLAWVVSLVHPFHPAVSCARICRPLFAECGTNRPSFCLFPVVSRPLSMKLQTLGNIADAGNHCRRWTITLPEFGRYLCGLAPGSSHHPPRPTSTPGQLVLWSSPSPSWVNRRRRQPLRGTGAPANPIR